MFKTSHPVPDRTSHYKSHANIVLGYSILLLKMVMILHVISAIFLLIDKTIFWGDLYQISVPLSLMLLITYGYQRTQLKLNLPRIIFLMLMLLPWVLALIWRSHSDLWSIQAARKPAEILLQTGGVQMSWVAVGLHAYVLFKRVEHYHLSLEYNISSLDDHKLGRLQVALKGLMVMALFQGVKFVPDSLLKQEFIFSSPILFLISTLTILLLVIYFLYHHHSTKNMIEENDWVEYSKKHQNIYLPQSKALERYFIEGFSSKDLYIGLVKELEEKKYFTNRSFNIADFSKVTNVPSQIIALVILENYGTSFYRWINHFRSSHLQEKLASPDFSDQPIAKLCQDTGFSSQKNADEMFQKFYLMPPGVYRSRHMNTNSPVSS